GEPEWAPPQKTARHQDEEQSHADDQPADEHQRAKEPRGRSAEEADDGKGRDPAPLVAPEVDDLGAEELRARDAGALAEVLDAEQIAAAGREQHVEEEPHHHGAERLAVAEAEERPH